MSLRSKKYDVADYLDSTEMVAAHLDAAFESGDTSRIAEALGEVARARGMTKISKATGLAREQLYKTLSVEGKPEFSTVLKVMAALGGGLKTSFPKLGIKSRDSLGRTVPSSGLITSNYRRIK